MLRRGRSRSRRGDRTPEPGSGPQRGDRSQSRCTTRGLGRYRGRAGMVLSPAWLRAPGSPRPCWHRCAPPRRLWCRRRRRRRGRSTNGDGSIGGRFERDAGQRRLPGTRPRCGRSWPTPASSTPSRRQRDRWREQLYPSVPTPAASLPSDCRYLQSTRQVDGILEKFAMPRNDRTWRWIAVLLVARGTSQGTRASDHPQLSYAHPEPRPTGAATPRSSPPSPGCGGESFICPNAGSFSRFKGLAHVPPRSD